MTMRMRSLLFAPGNKPEMLAKMSRSGPDAAIIDLEDAVPAAAKADARVVAREAVLALSQDAPSMLLFVRVNPVVSEYFGDDLDSLLPVLSAVVVPKLESAAEVVHVGEALDERGLKMGILAGLETAAGVERSVEILGAPGVAGAYFGAEDYIADMGGQRTIGNMEVLYARSRVALAARLAGVPAVDQIVADFGDTERFVREAAEARAMGFVGKICIHPAQVGLANTAFVPSAEEVERASALLDAYDAAVERGEAAVAFDGQMVDEPVARQARSVLARAHESDS